MHIHDANLYQIFQIAPTAGTEGALSRRRAENLRKRLMANADETDGITSPDEANMLEYRMDAKNSRLDEDDEYHHGGAMDDEDEVNYNR